MKERRQDLITDTERKRSGTALLELIDRTLDKGIMLEGYARVPLLGIDVLTLDIRAFVASCDKYLEYAEAIQQSAGAVENDALEQESLPYE